MNSASRDEQRLVQHYDGAGMSCNQWKFDAFLGNIEVCRANVPEPEADIPVYKYEKYQTVFIPDVM